MKKIFLILLILSLISCKKEDEKTFTVRFSSASEVRDPSNITPTIICQINGQKAEIYNPVTGVPQYTCKSGDVLKFQESGWDWSSFTATLTPPYMIATYDEGYVESYIIVDNQVVQSYKGNGDSNLQYTIP